MCLKYISKLHLASVFFAIVLMSENIANAQENQSDRASCQRTLEAMHNGDTREIVRSELQGRKVSDAEEKQFLQTAQRGLEIMEKVGGGLPINKSTYSDVILADGDPAKIAEWVFPNGMVGYAGCVRYRDLNEVEVSITRLNSDLKNLEIELNTYVHNRLVLK